MEKFVAFIGSRDTTCVSEEVRALYDKAACAAAWAGYTVVTGAAKGFDQIAAASALSAHGAVKIVLPWSNYEKDWYTYKMRSYPSRVYLETYYPPDHKDWTESVKRYHPAWQNLTQGGFALHARNYGIVSCATQVVAVPNPNKPGGGGTGQGIRIAKDLGIKVYDLTNDADFNELNKKLKIFEEVSQCDLG